MTPAPITAKADRLLTGYLEGEIQARKLTKVGGLTIEVNYRYRLLCMRPEQHKDRCAWSLLTHEAYNKLTSRPIRHH